MRYSRSAPIADAHVVILAAVTLVLIKTVAAIGVTVLVEPDRLTLRTYWFAGIELLFNFLFFFKYISMD